MAEIKSNITPWSEIRMKNYQWLDEYLQKQPSTEKEYQPAWQAYKYLLCGKMYAYIGVDDRNGRPVITLNWSLISVTCCAASTKTLCQVTI